MAIVRTDISAEKFSPKNTRIFSLHSSYLNGRADVSCYSDVAGVLGEKVENVPVIFLLHGVYGSHWSWLSSGGIGLVYDALKRKREIDSMLLVMPSDGLVGDGSGYLSEIGGKNIEKYLVEDLPLALKENFSFVSDSSNFYIAGLSMGGYGAMRLGAKYSDIFQGISALSACTSLNDVEGFTRNALPSGTGDHSLVYLFEKNREALPPLRFDCGRDDDLISANEHLHQQLLATGIEHVFEINDGGHTWEYWHQYISKTLRFFSDIERERNK